MKDSWSYKLKFYFVIEKMFQRSLFTLLHILREKITNYVNFVNYLYYGRINITITQQLLTFITTSITLFPYFDLLVNRVFYRL